VVRRRLLIVTAGILVALFVMGVWVGLRRSLVADIVRAEAEARLSAALGQRVTIGETGFSLVPRPSFTGSDVRVGETDQQAPAVTFDRVRIVPRLRSFFSETVRIEEIRLDGFTLSILRDSEGRWHLPAAFPAPSQNASSGVVVDRVRIAGGRLRVFDGPRGEDARETSSIDDIQADMLIDGGGLQLRPLRGRVGNAAIDGEASVDAQAVRLAFDAASIGDADLPALLGLLGTRRPPVVRLDEPAAASVTVSIDRSSSRLTGKGTLRAPALTVEPLRLQRLAAPFTIAGSQITFTPTTFVLNGGSHSGRVLLALDADPPRWSADSRVEALDVGALLDTLAARDARIDGTGRIDAKLQGRVEESFVNGMEGRAHLVISDGVLEGFALVAAVNRALRLAESESTDTRFERLTATLAIARAAAVTDDLVMNAGHVRVELAGRIGFDRTLDLRGSALVSADRVSAAVASVRELARARNARGEIEVPLTIAGTLDTPRFGLDIETAIRQGVRDELMRRLRGIIRRVPEPRP
jgi:uncharacterized protein involved in outer membrane biogenesis